MDGHYSHTSQSKTRTRVAVAEANSRSPQQELLPHSNGISSTSGPQPVVSSAMVKPSPRLPRDDAEMAMGDGNDASGETSCRTSSAYILLQLRDMGRTSSGSDALPAGSGEAPSPGPRGLASISAAAKGDMAVVMTSNDKAQSGHNAFGVEDDGRGGMSNRGGIPVTVGGNRSHLAGDDNTVTTTATTAATTRSSGGGNGVDFGEKGRLDESSRDVAHGGVNGIFEGSVKAAGGIERSLHPAALLPGFHGSTPGRTPTAAPSTMPQLQQQQARSVRAGRPAVLAQTSSTATVASTTTRAQGRAQARPSPRPHGGRSSHLAAGAVGTIGANAGAPMAVGGSGLRPICPKGGSTEPLVISPATGQLVPVSDAKIG